MVAALFCHPKSIYKTLPGVDAWDRQRDALKWPGGEPIIAWNRRDCCRAVG